MLEQQPDEGAAATAPQLGWLLPPFLHIREGKVGGSREGTQDQAALSRHSSTGAEKRLKIAREARNGAASRIV